MNNTTKGALATAAAAALLMGGASTLASWSDDATVEGGSVTTGSLSLDAVSCDSDWVYDDGALLPNALTNGIVPGDAITKSCTFTIGAVGDNLAASPSVPGTITVETTAVGSGDSVTPATLELPVTATYKLGTADFTSDDTITEADDGKTLTATIVVSFPFGDPVEVNANDTQNVVATLDGLTVGLTQVDPGL